MSANLSRKKKCPVCHQDVKSRNDHLVRENRPFLQTEPRDEGSKLPHKRSRSRYNCCSESLIYSLIKDRVKLPYCAVNYNQYHDELQIEYRNNSTVLFEMSCPRIEWIDCPSSPDQGCFSVSIKSDDETQKVSRIGFHVTEENDNIFISHTDGYHTDVRIYIHSEQKVRKIVKIIKKLRLPYIDGALINGVVVDRHGYEIESVPSCPPSEDSLKFASILGGALASFIKGNKQNVSA